jgi:ribonuclease D
MRFVSFDIEYHRNSHEPAIVSMALTKDVAILWHRPSFARHVPKRLAQLLLSERYPKVGFALDNDIWKLCASTDLLGHGWPKGMFDVQTYHRLLYNQTDAVGMTAAVNAVLHKPFTKIPHSGDWGQEHLSPDQITYAAGDVFITHELVHAIQNTH